MAESDWFTQRSTSCAQANQPYCQNRYCYSQEESESKSYPQVELVGILKFTFARWMEARCYLNTVVQTGHQRLDVPEKTKMDVTNIGSPSRYKH